jgi:hypothetical protein
MDMANMKYFSGETELTRLSIMDNASFAAAFPGVHGVRYDGFSKRIGFAAGSITRSRLSALSSTRPIHPSMPATPAALTPPAA